MAGSRSSSSTGLWTRFSDHVRLHVFGHRYQKEATFLLILGLSIFYLLAVQDYSPRDASPFSHTFPPRNVENICGWLGAYLAGWSHFFFGLGSYLVPVPFLAMGYLLVREQPMAFSWIRWVGWSLLFLSFLTFVHFVHPHTTIMKFTLPSGGAIGEHLAKLFTKIFGKVGAYVLLLTVTFCAINFVSHKSWLSSLMLRMREKSQGMSWPKFSWSFFKREKKTKEHSNDEKVPSLIVEDKRAIYVEPPVEKINPARQNVEPSFSPSLAPAKELFDDSLDEEEIYEEDGEDKDRGTVKSDYVHPSTTIFRSSPALGPLKEEQKREFEQTAQDLTKAFENFAIIGSVVAIQPGPVVTVYEFRPDAGTKISKIMGLIDDIALALRVDSVLMNPVCGKSAIGVQVPNKERDTVYLGDVVNAPEFKNSSSPMTLALGKSLAGDPVCADLTTMPHLLAAGATGSGKSVAVNSLLCSVILKSSPEEVRMILVDPKMLELSVYEGIPHLLLPVITDAKKASSALRWACYEMERRYRLMQLAKVRHIRGFNQFWDKASAEEKAYLREEMGDDRIVKLPYILLVIDELADLMLTAPKDVETSIQRLAQKARASGIHLVLATQRPSVDIITGVIKANLPCRISFQTVSKHDSRTILDQVGAEKLLGKGDMLFQKPGTSRLERIQGAFIEDDEVMSLVEAIRSDDAGIYDPDVMDWIEKEFERSYDENAQTDEIDIDDPKFDMAVDLAARHGVVSASFLQRHLKIGYNRAARIVETMEAQGMVGAADGSKPRRWIGPMHQDHDL